MMAKVFLPISYSTHSPTPNCIILLLISSLFLILYRLATLTVQMSCSFNSIEPLIEYLWWGAMLTTWNKAFYTACTPEGVSIWIGTTRPVPTIQSDHIHYMMYYEIISLNIAATNYCVDIIFPIKKMMLSTIILWAHSCHQIWSTCRNWINYGNWDWQW